MNKISYIVICFFIGVLPSKLLAQCCTKKTIKDLELVIVPTGYDYKKIKLELMDNTETTLEALKGKPTFLTALYTSCSNPYKCPATAKWVSSFSKNQDLNKFNIIVLTYDHKDSVESRSRYAKEYDFPSNVKFCRVKGNAKQFFKALNFKVSFNKSQVALHAREYKLLDLDQKLKLEKVAGTWDEGNIFSQLKKMTNK